MAFLVFVVYILFPLGYINLNESREEKMKISLKKIREIYEEEIFNTFGVFGTDLTEEGWAFRLNSRKRSTGLCNYSKKTIELSRFYLTDLVEIRDTIKHEIAHALTPGDDHGPDWENTFKELGGSGERYAKVSADEMPDPTWVLINSQDNEVLREFYRKPSKDYSKVRIKGQADTLGKLQVISYKEYKLKAKED